jgi:predicted PurR-regulated permease PerM
MDNVSERSAPPARENRDLERTVDMLATLIGAVVSVSALYIARDIFVPIAIAVLLSFVLSQPVLWLRRVGLPRVAAVIIVVLASLVVAFAVSAALTRQVSELAVNLPRYQTTISGKINRLRDMVSANAVIEKAATELKSLGALGGNRANSTAQSPPQLSGADEDHPIPVEVREPAPSSFALVRTIVGTALSPIETSAIVAIFLIFILVQREDLRDRFVRLVGRGDLQRTTVAMDDAAGRLSRYFLAQTTINAAFGVVVTGGLYAIGVPSPILFGILAFLMRFVPYVGPIVAAGFPVALAAAVDPGWAMALETLALFIVVEMLVGYLIEPLLYGRNTGLSPIAVVVAATFWTWLWGPIGLVLSTPLTACLVVIGRHVKQLDFLDVILGDAPALTPVEHFYQRLLVGDAAEITEGAERFLKANSLAAYYDEVALKGLLMASADLTRGALDVKRQQQIKDTVAEMIENLSDRIDEPPPVTNAPAPGLGEGLAPPRGEAPLESAPPQPNGPRKPILCIAVASTLDEAAAALLAELLEKHGLEAKIEPAELLTVGGILHLSGAGAQIICLSYLSAEISAARMRYAIRRLRRRLPQARIAAAFWLCDPERANELCVQTKADACVTCLADAVRFCVAEAKAQGRFDAPIPADPRAVAASGALGTATLAGAA